MGESVGQGVGVGRRAILVFFGVWRWEKRGWRVFSFLDFFLRVGQVFVLLCV